MNGIAYITVIYYTLYYMTGKYLNFDEKTIIFRMMIEEGNIKIGMFGVKTIIYHSLENLSSK